MSSSSVYDPESSIPFNEETTMLKPLSPYGKSKLLAEQLCKKYHDTYQLQITVIRPFTVYGPEQRPDMAINRFASNILAGKSITLYNQNIVTRDFTYVTDLINALTSLLLYPSTYSIINIGSGIGTSLSYIYSELSNYLNKKVEIIHQAGFGTEAQHTCADISKAKRMINYKPNVSINEGLQKFCKWIKQKPITFN
jgi:nucleoside-diphosphate-sugar epimerase